MCFLFSLIPTTLLVVVGYFVLFSSGKAREGIRRFGQVLAAWIFVVALMPLLGGAYATSAGVCPMTYSVE